MSYPQGVWTEPGHFVKESLLTGAPVETIGVKRPQAADRWSGRTAGPGSCRSRRNETDVDIVPARPKNAPLDDPMPLHECIAELAALLWPEGD